ncbi:MAG: Recombinase [Sphingomonas bacterium]|nr:Recombinase [Sphingomonas bacterium]
MLVHNRTTKVPHPRTRRELIRPNPEADWITEPVEQLRIIPDELWDAVAAMRSRNDGVRPELRRRPKHLLSGIAACGICGGGWTVIGRDRWGCGRYRDGGGCSNNRTIMTHLLEERVLSGLRHRMLDPELVSIFVREYHREYARRSSSLSAERGKLERRLAEAAAKVDRLVDAIANGADEFTEVGGALSKARAERERLSASIAEVHALP